ncbi:MAG: YggS family pyridoxal phosphate-dependent enzyme [Rickettsiales bacterium]
MNLADKLADNIEVIRKSIENSKAASHISAKAVTLLAASKTQPVSVIEEAIRAGISCFGENRVQEAREKWSELKGKHSNVKLHLIGALQTNKVKQALTLFDVIQTLDRESLAEVLSAEIKKNSLELGVLSAEEERNKTQNSALKTQHFYIQVNTGKEQQKSGVFPENADEFIAYCRSLDLPVVGLMCVPPADQPSAPHFALLREIALRNNLAELSMGMSDDFEIAVRMGSSCVRVGTALFGRRD